MPKASEVAAELRKLADSLDLHPELSLVTPDFEFYCSTKEQFLHGATVMPRPIDKSESDKKSDNWSRIRLDHKTDALHVRTSVLKNLTCQLVEPAKPAVYRCESILSAIEELEVA